MKTRCYNPNCNSYHRYGGRGIKVFPAWHDYAVFLADMGVRPPGTSLDRIDTNGDYEPGNCKWSTLKEQSNNRRDCNYQTYDGQTKTVTEWAATVGLSRNALRCRLKTLPISEALFRSGTRVRKRKPVSS